jgi:hypothetical protein
MRFSPTVERETTGAALQAPPKMNHSGAGSGTSWTSSSWSPAEASTSSSRRPRSNSRKSASKSFSPAFLPIPGHSTSAVTLRDCCLFLAAAAAPDGRMKPERIEPPHIADWCRYSGRITCGGGREHGRTVSGKGRGSFALQASAGGRSGGREKMGAWAGGVGRERQIFFLF